MKSPPIKFIVSLIRIYQFLLSPFLKDSCRFTPSCSSYTIEAVERRGVLGGLSLSLRRILSCHPFCNKSGYDPVP